MSDIYTDFAYIYDDAMDQVPYEQWLKNVTEILKKYNIEDGLLCELGCGTGMFTRMLAEKGYDMTGVDFSEDMLEVAREAEEEEPFDILYLHQDIREFELFGTVRAFVAVCDTMNYLTEKEDFVQTLKLVNNYLDRSGIFIFDLKTEHMYKNIIGENSRSEVGEDFAYIWENTYDEKDRLNTYVVTMFVQEEAKRGSYSRSEEVHFQKAYSADEVKSMILEAGLEFVEVLDADTMKAPVDNTERLYFVVREKFQEGKFYTE